MNLKPDHWLLTAFVLLVVMANLGLLFLDATDPLAKSEDTVGHLLAIGIPAIGVIGLMLQRINGHK